MKGARIDRRSKQVPLPPLEEVEPLEFEAPRSRPLEKVSADLPEVRSDIGPGGEPRPGEGVELTFEAEVEPSTPVSSDEKEAEPTTEEVSSKERTSAATKESEGRPSSPIGRPRRPTRPPKYLQDFELYQLEVSRDRDSQWRPQNTGKTQEIECAPLQGAETIEPAHFGSEEWTNRQAGAHRKSRDLLEGNVQLTKISEKRKLHCAGEKFIKEVSSDKMEKDDKQSSKEGQERSREGARERREGRCAR